MLNAKPEKRIDDFVPQPILAVLMSERFRVLYDYRTRQSRKASPPSAANVR
jgi:hypothetical protein